MAFDTHPVTPDRVDDFVKVTNPIAGRATAGVCRTG